jgi:myo-inositol-1(or 4)-monophosphatase
MKRRDFAIDVALRAGNVVMRYYNSCLIENMSIDDKKNTATLADRASQVEIESALKAHPDFRWEIIVAEEKPYDRHEVSPSGYTWVIDPLDGTTNFQNRIPFFCTAIGVLKDGHPHIGVVYDPTANKVYYAMEGDRTQVWSVSSGEVIHISTEKEITRLEDCLAGTHISSRPEIAKRLLQDDLLLDIAKNVKHLRAFGCGQLALAYTASGRLQLFFQFGPHLWDQVAGIVLVQNAGGIVSQLPSGGDWDYSARDIAASANEDLHRDFLDLLKHRS